MKFSTVLTFGVLGVFLLMGCKKDGPTPITNKEIIIDRPWILTDILNRVGSDTSLESKILDCQKDNIWDFQNYGAIIADEGNILCDSIAPQSTTYIWSSNQEDNTIYLSLVYGDLSIILLTDNRMELMDRYNKLGIVFTRN